jgi:hypothetical protein
VIPKLREKPLRYREIEHDNLAWALDEFLAIKVEDLTLVILASKLKGEISSCLHKYPIIHIKGILNRFLRGLSCSILDSYPWIGYHQVILMIHPCKREDLS